MYIHVCICSKRYTVEITSVLKETENHLVQLKSDDGQAASLVQELSMCICVSMKITRVVRGLGGGGTRIRGTRIRSNILAH